MWRRGYIACREVTMHARMAVAVAMTALAVAMTSQAW